MDSFIKHVEQLSKKRDVKLSLINAPSVITGGVACSGYFSGDDKELVVATGKDKQDWLEILVHESCHMDQWFEKAPVWMNLDISGSDTNYIGLFDKWLGKEIELDKSTLRSCIQAIIDVEIDCEKRAVDLIKKFNLDIDVDNYIRKSNAYVLFYHVVRSKRLWSLPGKAPYMISQLVEMMPNHFDIDYSNPPPQLLGLIEKKCFR